MEKEALLTIILQDIKELETLVNTFKGKKVIPDVFIQLSKSKTQGILDEIQLLATVKDVQEPSEPVEKRVDSNPPVSTSTHEEQPQPSEAPKTEKPPVQDKKPTEDKSVHNPILPPKNGSNTTVLGELLGKDKLSFNEKLVEQHNTGTTKSLPPISDLRKAIGVNDRFFFQRELFGSNTDVFNQTVDQLNNMENLDDAIAFVSANFNWDPRNEAVTSFMALLRRRYIKP